MSKHEPSKSNDVANGHSDLDSTAFAGFSNADFGDFAADIFGSASSELGDLDQSDVMAGTFGSDLELNDAESAIIRLVETKIAGKRGRIAASKSEKIYITHEDFEEGPERDAFLLIYGYAEILFAKEPIDVYPHKDLQKAKAVRFFFCHTLAELSFVDAVACIDNRIRIDVLRLRFMLEFWLRGWELPSMPDDAEPLPARIELSAAKHEDIIGITIAREAWFEPGIKADALINRVLEGRNEIVLERIKRAFKGLVLDYVLSIADGKVYTTGKNPILELEDNLKDPTLQKRSRLGNIYWSRRF